MNIKRESTVQLAREVAALTGESVTAAVEAALAERLERLRSDDRAAAAARDKAARFARIREISEESGRLWGGGPSARELVDDLYDEHGLPR